MNPLKFATFCIILVLYGPVVQAESRTLKLNDCDIAEEPLPETPTLQIIWKLAGKPEAYSVFPEHMVQTTGSPFVDAAGHAFATHRPLRISPDHIWLIIAQGFAAHINTHADELRDHFVSHSGKKVLQVKRDDFKKGRMQNPWEEVFPEFSNQIGEHIGEDTRQLITASFSTTTPAEQAAFEITLMNAMQHYFSYSISTYCGIPEIILEGTTEDWKSLRERAGKLAQYDLEWWTAELDPILAAFVDASEGRLDLEFWNSFYKRHQTSGSSYINGWIVKLFPYLRRKNGTLYRNPVFDEDAALEPMIDADDFPLGLSMVPFVWKHHNRQYNMEFMAGFIGIAQDPETQTLRPEIGWIIRDKPTQPFWKKWLGI
ncbi:DUF4419 domain-containing protein [Verrucomicrobia bacterium S94]|nr:DUF4419 domain-containing protein [Verrucomicrobia bacterium S94]